MSLYEQTAKALRLLELQKTVVLDRPKGSGLQSFRSTIYNVLSNTGKKAKVVTLEDGRVSVTVDDGHEGTVIKVFEFSEEILAASSVFLNNKFIQGIEFLGTPLKEVQGIIDSYTSLGVKAIETKSGTLLRGLTLTEQQLINLPGDEENESKGSEQGQDASTPIAADAAGE